VLKRTLPLIGAALAGALLAAAFIVRPAAKILRLWAVTS
jgi:hypothetical protein